MAEIRQVVARMFGALAIMSDMLLDRDQGRCMARVNEMLRLTSALAS